MLEALFSLIAATTLLLGSPGPAPLALAASGATFGIRKSSRFLIGILLGLSVAIVGATAGLAALLVAWPEARFAVQLCGALYIGYIAIKIATAPVLDQSQSAASQAPSLLDGFIFNLLNPKAYAAFFAIFSQFLLPIEKSGLSYIATGLVCLMVAAVVDFIWLCLGGILRPVFYKPKQARMIRVCFALLMIIAVLAVFLRESV
ncbi:LysE family translocator [Microbulbifer sp. OS29]|uniref:LysE family translocator n=1 Tax=Microbulbifer okhotskensis TaxID=2926617 RepID=A0A9X2ESB4_9GAMM|nr:LysE family translocator [Microbulbifer okhotskensis]MCO1334853.1 LysE family translocator [Microbulbifer okhotskensis]